MNRKEVIIITYNWCNFKQQSGKKIDHSVFNIRRDTHTCRMFNSLSHHCRRSCPNDGHQVSCLYYVCLSVYSTHQQFQWTPQYDSSLKYLHKFGVEIVSFSFVSQTCATNNTWWSDSSHDQSFEIWIVGNRRIRSDCWNLLAIFHEQTLEIRLFMWHGNTKNMTSWLHVFVQCKLTSQLILGVFCLQCETKQNESIVFYGIPNYFD